MAEDIVEAMVAMILAVATVDLQGAHPIVAAVTIPLRLADHPTVAGHEGKGQDLYRILHTEVRIEATSVGQMATPGKRCLFGLLNQDIET